MDIGLIIQINEHEVTIMSNDLKDINSKGATLKLVKEDGKPIELGTLAELQAWFGRKQIPFPDLKGLPAPLNSITDLDVFVNSAVFQVPSKSDRENKNMKFDWAASFDAKFVDKDNKLAPKTIFGGLDVVGFTFNKKSKKEIIVPKLDAEAVEKVTGQTDKKTPATGTQPTTVKGGGGKAGDKAGKTPPPIKK